MDTVFPSDRCAGLAASKRRVSSSVWPRHGRGTRHIQGRLQGSGVLVELRADVGDRVAKGAVLARLDDREQQRASAEPRRPPSRPKQICNGRWRMSKRRRQTMPTPKPSMSAGKSWFKVTPPRSKTAETAKTVARRRTCGCESWPRAMSRWRVPPSATPRRNCSRKARHWISTRSRRPTMPW